MQCLNISTFEYYQVTFAHHHVETVFLSLLSHPSTFTCNILFFIIIIHFHYKIKGMEQPESNFKY